MSKITRSNAAYFIIGPRTGRFSKKIKIKDLFKKNFNSINYKKKNAERRFVFCGASSFLAEQNPFFGGSIFFLSLPLIIILNITVKSFK